MAGIPGTVEVATLDGGDERRDGGGVNGVVVGVQVCQVAAVGVVVAAAVASMLFVVYPPSPACDEILCQLGYVHRQG